MPDEKQLRLEARARIDIKNLYDRGQVSPRILPPPFAT